VSGPLRATGPSSEYAVQVEREALDKGLASLSPAAQLNVLEFMSGHMIRTPRQRMPGKLKQLKGEYRAYYQYDIDRRNRLIYSVDDDTKTVYVEHIGPHPQWKKRGRRAF
jgi:mRNA-degrading endonuclease RelE of RelBE toxin-antitoxin system